MIICGLKFTHDAAIVIIDNGKLIFSYEVEKMNNNDRFSSMKDLDFEFIEKVLNEHHYSLSKMDRIVIDGWGEFNFIDSVSNDYPIAKTSVKYMDNEFEIELAPYGMCVIEQDLLKKYTFNYPQQHFKYNSYMHVSGHVTSAYCTSPFAQKEEDSFVLIWDGGMCPQLFYFHGKKRCIENLGGIFFLQGYMYGAFANNYKPFDQYAFDDPGIAGKVMAYIALGTLNQDALKEFHRLFKLHEKQFAAAEKGLIPEIPALTTKFLSDLLSYGDLKGIESKDMMATFHVFIQEILVECLSKALVNFPHYKKNLCFAGGCALNIKWNSAIRDAGLFNAMWVPPFPNDSGSAIGAACCEMIVNGEKLALDWNVYSGPSINKSDLNNKSWNSFNCSIKELAMLLHYGNEPVVFLNGCAELGPRALGNRSIIAPAVSEEMKEELNRIKNRENYRPVAPICLEEDAPSIFTPGSPDPLMLYDHLVKDKWKKKVPAICHLDGSARLQTVNRNENPIMYELLQEYKRLSGIPLLCNTSANLKGKGFFPDVTSAMKWGGASAIWTDGTLFLKEDAPGNKLFAEIRKGIMAPA